MNLQIFSRIISFVGLTVLSVSCGSQKDESVMVRNELQVSFSEKNHALDNNDNFSPDDRFLCYDTRGTVYNKNLGNCKSIEKVEIATGRETVLWEPESVTGEEPAPGVAAVSWHPAEDKVIFIHGPLLSEVKERGYYGIRNRTGVEVSADGTGKIIKTDCRDVSTGRPTLPGAHRGGTHRHEYSRNGNRIGFTYDDFLLPQFDRTIGYMEPNNAAPEGYTHYFAVLLKPVETGKSKPGEIEKAYGDSWVDREGTMRAFVGKVRSENGLDYDTALFVADVPEDVDVTTSYSGDKDNYPKPPEGVKIRRLTYDLTVHGVVRGSPDGNKIAFLAEDENGIKQAFIIDSRSIGSNFAAENHPGQVSRFSSDASSIRWHPSGDWVFTVVNGNIAALYLGEDDNFGATFWLTNDEKERTELVVSNNGNMLAYNMLVPDETGTRLYKQIFVLEPEMEKLRSVLK